MRATTAAILSALAGSDKGALSLRLDELVYSEDAVRRYAAGGACACLMTVERVSGALWLHLEATDPAAARHQVGEALTGLLRSALQAQ